MFMFRCVFRINSQQFSGSFPQSRDNRCHVMIIDVRCYRLWTCSWRPTWFSRALRFCWMLWRIIGQPRDRCRQGCLRWTWCMLHRWDGLIDHVTWTLPGIRSTLSPSCTWYWHCWHGWMVSSDVSGLTYCQPSTSCCFFLPSPCNRVIMFSVCLICLFVCPVRYRYHDISWTPWTVLIKLTGNIC